MANVANQIEGKLIGTFISTNLVTPDWKEIVCGQDAGLDMSKDVTTTTTKCGTLKSTGPASWTLTGSGVANHTPDADELSANDIIAIAQGTTDVLVKLVHVDNEELYYRQGRGQMTAYSEAGNVGDPLTFDYTIEISGDLVTVAP